MKFEIISKRLDELPMDADGALVFAKVQAGTIVMCAPFLSPDANGRLCAMMVVLRPEGPTPPRP